MLSKNGRTKFPLRITHIRGLAPPFRAGRGLYPRPERSTHAKAGGWRTENRNQIKDSFRGDVFPDLELRGNI